MVKPLSVLVQENCSVMVKMPWSLSLWLKKRTPTCIPTIMLFLEFMHQERSVFRFPYSKDRPILSAQLSRNKKTRYFNFLIDSGSHYTLLSSGDALTFGLDYNMFAVEERKVEIADNSDTLAKRTTFDLILEGMIFRIPVLFAKGHVDCLLGRNGVFDRFDIIFQQRKRQVFFCNDSMPISGL